jgi:CBS domain-containing protein
VATVLWALGVSNIFLGIFNALPGLPLDGGAVLKSVVWGITREEARGTVVAAWSGRIVAVLVFVALVWPDLSQGRAPDITSVIFGGMISAYLFSGASQSLAKARISRRVPGITARSLARGSIAVGADVPLSEALRQATAAGATGMVVVDSAGHPTAIAQQNAVDAVPVERRPWVPVGSVSAALDPRAALPADLAGMDLLHAMQAVPAAHYLVVEAGGALVGVLSTADVEAALSGSGRG